MYWRYTVCGPNTFKESSMRNWKVGVGLLAVALVAGLLTFYSNRTAAGSAVLAADVAGPRYTVVATDGTHLIVTDNQEAKVFFYAIEKDGKPGDELKLRGTADLKDIGKPVIKPTLVK
jgi:hypothetical protein